MKPRIDADVEFQFLKVGQEDYDLLEYRTLDAKAILIPDQESSRDALDQMELEEYEFDIVWSPEKNLWVTTLMNGTYLINVKAKGYKEVNEVIKISPSSSIEYKYVMKEASKDIPKI